MDETFSSIELITECLSDPERTPKFIKAIEKLVKEGDLVLDSGTGSAILAMAAARAGAKKVIALEFDPYIAGLAEENILKNGFSNAIKLVESDARTVDLKEEGKFDVVIMEMLTTGMVDEHQVWAINNLHQKGLVDKNTKFIPERQDTFVALAYKDFEAFGFSMRMVRHLWKWLPEHGLNFLSDDMLLSSISFNQENDLTFKGKVIFDVKKEGVVNSIYFSSKTILDDSLEVGDTYALNAPIAFPLKEDLIVKVGEKIKIEVEYTFGGGYRNLHIKSISKI